MSDDGLNEEGDCTLKVKGNHLVPVLQGKCVIVKDVKVLLEPTPQHIENVFRELREIYDGKRDASADTKRDEVDE